MKSTNPFAKISTINDAVLIATQCRQKAMKTSVQGTGKTVPLTIRSKRKEIKRIENYAKNIREKLTRILEEFPERDDVQVHPFYLDMIDFIMGLDKFHQTLGSFQQTINTVWKIAHEHINEIWNETEISEIKRHRTAAVTRITSLVLLLDDRLKELENLRQLMRVLPGFDFDEMIICIAGVPNAGKSSLVKTITTATPAVGTYPFTTKKATLGHYTSSNGYVTCQLVDTPGMLDRPGEERNVIEKRAFIAIKNLPTGILFLIDPTEEYPIENQVNLLVSIHQYTNSANLWIAITKCDLFTAEELKNIQEKTNKIISEKLNYQKDVFLISITDPLHLRQIMDSILASITLPLIKHER